MDKEKEINNLTRSIKIPVSDINFVNGYCEVISDNIHIGNLNYIIHANIITYDYNADSIAKLNWSVVYQNNKSDIIDLIKKELALDDVIVKIGSFRRLYVYDTNENLIASFQCIYENLIWKVFKEDKNED